MKTTINKIHLIDRMIEFEEKYMATRNEIYLHEIRGVIGFMADHREELKLTIKI